MIFKLNRRLHDIGVLGINRRNADYIMKCNPRSSFPIVDNKLLTKRLAEKHQIPTPPLYHVIEHYGDMAGLKKALIHQREFVVKPARGTGGSGILLISDHTAQGFLKQNGEIIPWTELTYHISDILSGIYSLEGLEDRVLIEALVHPDPIFAAISYQGVPDLRIVVYRGVPVMGMVRLPTRASDGKANLHRGAIGVGIDICKGKTLTGVHHSKVVTHHSDTGHPVGGLQVPYWEPILRIAAKSFDMTGLGFLGVDIVIDCQRGPLLLELNARPGLQIQIANQMGLRKRLELIDKASPDIFRIPEARIAWALETFATPISKLSGEEFPSPSK